MIKNQTKEKILSIVTKHNGKIKFESEAELAIFFKHDFDLISCKIDIIKFYSDVYNYLPKELIIRF